MTVGKPTRRSVLGLLLAPAFAWAGRAEPRITLGAAADLFDSRHGRWLTLLYTEAFRRLGYRVIIRRLPTRRSRAMAAAGLVDGELNRVASYGAAHPELVRVPTPHFTLGFAAYGRASTRLDGWTGLARGTARVEYRSGVHWCEERLPLLVPAARLSHVNSVVQGLHKLRLGHTDIYVDLETAVDPLLAAPPFAGARLRKLVLLETVPMHAYLRREHAALAAPLGQALAVMQRDGTAERLRRQAWSGPERGAAGPP